MMKRFLLIVLALCLAAAGAQAKLTIVKSGKPTARIVANIDNDVDKQAAELLQDFVQRISGAKLPIVSGKSAKGDVVIGQGSTEGLTEDGFRLATRDGRLYISSGGDKGALYGVVTLLENYLGVAYYAAGALDVPSMSTIELPDINHHENPAFRYRQSQNYSMATDPLYRIWFRLEEPKDEFAGGNWVHTFNRILPSDRFGETHPEYYSFINGKRRPGHASQWCLTNPEVFEAAAAQIDSIFRANPGTNMISVSQNDGNFTNCHCPECEAVDEYEGALSGNFIRFMNRLAERFPDKQFSTLAYLFTMHPPKHVKPLPNVNIMLCDIDCKREVPLTDNASGRDFVSALEGWAKISNNIFVWDYGINFDNYLSPFPNFPIIQKNIQLFKKNHVTMHFSQIASSRGGDFAEMRTYMVSKLMWNPDLDCDSLMRAFMNGYYGKAAPYIYQYEKKLEGALLASGKELWIYDSPVTHKDGMLNANCRRAYNELFDQAEAAVAGEKKYLDRVRLSRLPLQYSELEIERAQGIKDYDEVARKLDLFESRVKEYDVPTVNERNNHPVDYCNLYRSRYLQRRAANLAADKPVTFNIAPSKGYAKFGAKALTDGLYGGTTFVESWVGWEGINADFVVDLGEERDICSVSIDCLHQLGAWILLPKGVKYSVSTDGTNYTPLGEYYRPEDRDPSVKFVEFKVEKAARARYIRAEVEGTIECPSWHYGVGHASWFFIDEIVVN